MAAKYRYSAIFNCYSSDVWDAQRTLAAIKNHRNSDCLLIFWEYGKSRVPVGIKYESKKHGFVEIIRANAGGTDETATGIKKIKSILAENTADAGIVYLIGLSPETEKALKDEFEKSEKKYRIEEAKNTDELYEKIEKQKKEDAEDEGDSLADQVDGTSHSRHDGKIAKQPDEGGEKRNTKPTPSSEKRPGSGRKSPLAPKQKPKAKQEEPQQPSHFDPEVQKEREAVVFSGMRRDSLDDFVFPMDDMETAKEKVASLTFVKTMNFLVSSGFGDMFISPNFMELMKNDRDAYRGKCNFLFAAIIMSPDPQECYKQWNIAEPNYCPQTMPDEEKMKRLEIAYPELQKQVNYYLELCNTLYIDDPS